MWVDGGRLYWGGEEIRKFEGVAVIFAWISIQEKHLRNYADMFASLGWKSLICQADFLSLFSTEKATSLAFAVLNELLEELKIRPCPVVFASFSGGSKSCTYKVFKIIEGTCEAQLNLDDNRLVRTCISGHIYDSGPVDFTSDVAAHFALHPTICKIPGSSKLLSWVAGTVASGLDALFLTQFDSQRIDYWQALYSSVSLGAPYLFLCSESDEPAPYHVVSKFAQRVMDLGGDVKLVKWNGSPHVGHFMNYPTEYKASVTNFLEKATVTYCNKIQQLRFITGSKDEISELICDLQIAAVNSNESLRRVATEPNDHFFLPSSVVDQNGRDSNSLQDDRKEKTVDLSNSPPSISAHSVLGEILFDACVPKNVEGWDIKFSGSLNGQPLGSACRKSPNAFKRLRRSRL